MSCNYEHFCIATSLQRLMTSKYPKKQLLLFLFPPPQMVKKSHENREREREREIPANEFPIACAKNERRSLKGSRAHTHDHSVLLLFVQRKKKSLEAFSSFHVIVAVTLSASVIGMDHHTFIFSLLAAFANKEMIKRQSFIFFWYDGYCIPTRAKKNWSAEMNGSSS